MYSGDSLGVILVWRLDAEGHYQLLRKFRKDDLDGKKIMTLQIHPDRTKNQLIVFAEPSFIRMYNLATYKPQASYSGAYIQGAFARATLSADGRFVMCGAEDTRFVSNSSEDANASTSSSKPSKIKVWDSQSGSLINCPLSDISLSYSVRSIGWSRTQHMIAVAIAGPGASVNIFTAEKESVLNVLERAEQSAASDYFQTLASRVESEREEGGTALDTSTVDPAAKPLLQNRAPPGKASTGRAESPSVNSLSAEDRKAKTAAIMAKMREKRGMQ